VAAWAAWTTKPSGYSTPKQLTTAGLARARLFCLAELRARNLSSVAASLREA
jgi:hypothetical protein